MAENRKASAQSVNDDTFEGDKLTGSGNDMASGYARGRTGLGRSAWPCGRLQGRGEHPDRVGAHPGGFEGAEVTEGCEALEAAMRERLHNGRREPRRTRLVASAGHHHRTSHLS